jgi:transposase
MSQWVRPETKDSVVLTISARGNSLISAWTSSGTTVPAGGVNPSSVWVDGISRCRWPARGDRGKSDTFLTVVSNPETGEPLWFGMERKKETLDEFFRTQLKSGQRRRIEAACLDTWEPFRLSMAEWVPGCRIVYDKFHIMEHANDAVNEVWRAELFRKGRKMRDVVKGKKWLLLSRWKNLAPTQRGVLNRLFQLSRRVFKAYLLKVSLEQLLWAHRYEGAMLN